MEPGSSTTPDVAAGLPQHGWLARPGARLALLFAAATAIGLLEAAQVYLGFAAGGNPIGLLRAITGTIPSWYIFAALAPAVLWVARRVRIERGRLAGALALHGVAAAVFASLHIVLSALLSEVVLARSGEPVDQMLARVFSLYFGIDFIFYWCLVGAYYAFDYHRRYRRHAELAAAELELRASRLEASLATANLAALKMQLHPHFLFNTLNAISALVHRDPAAADRMIARLGDLLRLTLEDVRSQEVTLERELDFLSTYLEIEQTRLGDRLAVEFDVEADALEAQVPHLLLQPLVENSIRHGIAPQGAGGRIAIKARRAGETLRIEVRDDGPGLPRNGAHGERGVGLRNTRARLEQLYGAAHTFELRNGSERGLVVQLAIPYHRGPAPLVAAGQEGGR